jgi:hypothetical protein
MAFNPFILIIKTFVDTIPGMRPIVPTAKYPGMIFFIYANPSFDPWMASVPNRHPVFTGLTPTASRTSLGCDHYTHFPAADPRIGVFSGWEGSFA